MNKLIIATLSLCALSNQYLTAAAEEKSQYQKHDMAKTTQVIKGYSTNQHGMTYKGKNNYSYVTVVDKLGNDIFCIVTPYKKTFKSITPILENVLGITISHYGTHNTHITENIDENVIPIKIKKYSNKSLSDAKVFYPSVNKLVVYKK